MAQHVLTDAYVVINSVNLSARITGVEVNYEGETRDGTAMGDGNRNNLPGLKNWSISGNINQDYASGQTDATLFGLVGTQFDFEIRPTSGSVSSTNPKFTGSGILTAYTPVGGEIGELHKSAFRIVPGDPGTLTRATS